eukprot:scaffold40835_cov191-Amphora_coffeaeformis.AAC.1
MEELEGLLKRELHYQCTNYFTPREVTVSKNGGRKGLESLPAPVLMNMLHECASLVTDTSSIRPVPPSPSSTQSTAYCHSTSATPKSPSSVSGMLAQDELRRSTRSAQSPLKASQDFVFWRKQMCSWAFTVVKNFDIDKETVSVAFNMLDRYVVHEEKIPGAPEITREDYQLFAMTALYIAVKVLEPYPRKIAVDALVVMSRDFYSGDDITHTEREMLKALNWNINPPTVLTFARNFMKSMENECDKLEMERICSLLSERIVADSFFVPLKDSVIGLACMMHATQLMGLPDDYVKQNFLEQVHRVVSLDDAAFLEAILERLDTFLR